MTEAAQESFPGHVLHEQGLRRWFEPEQPVGGIARIVFTTRCGGRSRPPYEGLNLGFHVGDVGERVRLNRLDVASSLPRSVRSPVVGEQVHGVRAEGVGPLHAGARWEAEEKTLLATDALVTATPALPLVTLVADCLPIALVDPLMRVAASVHAGWRGLAGDGDRGVIENTASLMRERWGTDPRNLQAWIGPAIGACCYEIGAEVADRFPDHASAIDGSLHLDLRGAAKDRLCRLGLDPAAIGGLPLCTACRDDLFFSHRRTTLQGGNTTGRQGLFVWMKPPKEA